MNGNRDIHPADSTEYLHPNPSARRKSAKPGYGPSKLPDSRNSLFSSSRKGQKVSNGRSATRAITETVTLATESQMSGLVGGKIVTKRSASPSFPSIAEGGIVNDEQDFLLKPNNVDEEMKKLEICSFSAHSADGQMPDHDWPRQQSSSEKVSKWLEESEHSTVIMTELADIHTLDDNEEEVVNGHLQSLATCCSPGTEIVSPMNAYQDAKQLVDRNEFVEILPNDNILRTPILVEVLINEDTRLANVRGFHLAKLSLAMRYFKITFCLTAAFLGLFMRMGPTSWDQYEPPPT